MLFLDEMDDLMQSVLDPMIHDGVDHEQLTPAEHIKLIFFLTTTPMNKATLQEA